MALVGTSRFLGVARNEFASQFLVNEASLYVKTGSYDDAVRVYREAIEIDPTDPKPYFYLGKTYATRGLYDQSKEVMEQAVRLNPNFAPYADLTLGVALANDGDYEEAATYFEAALEADGEICLAAFNLGYCMMQLGDYGEAESAFTRAEKLCTDDIGVLLAIARAYVGMGYNEKGISLAGDVLRREPSSFEAHYVAGLGLEARGEIEEALRHFRRALQIAPGSGEIREKVRDLESR
jgi:tetratricopeptide (TPR) repeat protein